MCFHSGIVNTQELSGTGHHVNVKVLALGSLFVHELKHRIGWAGMLEDGASDHEQSFSQMGRSLLRDTARLESNLPDWRNWIVLSSCGR